MNSEKRKRKKRQVRTQQIIDAAIETIKEKSLEKATMDEIAEHAELSKGALYFYFKDKSALLRAIQKESIRTLKNDFMRIIQQDEKGARLVQRMVESFLTFFDENPVLTKVLALNFKSIEPDENIEEEVYEIEKEIHLILTRALQVGIQDGSIQTSIDPKILAIQISFFMRGMLQFYLSSPQNHIQKKMNQHNLTLNGMAVLFIDALLNKTDTD